MSRFFQSLAITCILPLSLVEAEIRIPADTAYFAPNPHALHFGEREIRGWTDSSQQVLWFGKLRKAGTLQANVVLKLPAGAQSTLRLDVGEQSREVLVNGAEREITVPFGSFEMASPGYTRFRLASLNGPETAAGDLVALVLDGPAAEGAHFNMEPRRNAASVHLMYKVPVDGEVDALYCEAAAVEDPVHTFYMACGFQRGYFGMQVNSPTERRIIFSVWDSGAGQTTMKRDSVPEADRTRLVAKGEGVETKVFDGEGTGGHSHLKYRWRSGERQRFLVTARAAEEGAALYSGYWFHPGKKEWMLIASFRAPKADASLRRFHSFSENFVGSTGHLRRKALFCNQWVHTADGKWYEVTEASFSHDPTGKAARLDRSMGVEEGCFFLAHGGFVEGATDYGQVFRRPAAEAPPRDIDFTRLSTGK